MPEALTDEQRSAVYSCKECGKEEDPAKWIDGKKLAATGYCFSCRHWHGLLATKDAPRSVVAGGKAYRVGPQRTPGPYNGFGGHRFKIKFNDGREVETVDLWHVGDIPERFKERMPDNAVFLEGMCRHD